MLQYDTKLDPVEEAQFQTWKAKYAPKDSGTDYDLRGAFKAGLTPDPNTGHWPDTFKKPNHPTFSNESQYAVGPDKAKAGHWNGDTFVPPAKDPYTAELDRLQAESEKAVQGNASIDYAVQQSPDVYSKALQAQKDFQIPPLTAVGTMPATEQNLRAKQLQTDLSQAHPAVQSFFAPNAHALTVAQDDLPILSKITGFLSEIPYSVATFGPAVGEALSSTAGMILGRTADSIESQFGGPGPVSNFLRAAGANADVRAGRNHEVIQRLTPAEDRAKLGGVAQGVLSGVESLVQNIPTLAATIAGAPTIVGLTMGAVQSGAQTRTGAIEEGASRNNADFAFVNNAAIEAATEALPLSYFAELVGGKTGIMKYLAKEQLSEHLGEQAATFLQDLSDELTTHPETTLKQYFANHNFSEPAKQTFLATLTQGLIQSGAMSAVNTHEIQKQQADLAKRQTQALTKIDAAISESKLKGRSPDVFSTFIAGVAQGDIHINAQDLVQTLEKHEITLDEVREKVPSIDDQVDGALAMGGDVIVPMSEWASGMAGEKYNQDLIPKSRIGDTPLSEEDIKEFGEKQAIDDANKALEESANLQEHTTQVQQIQKGIAQQLIAARPDLYTAENAATSAALQGNFYSALANELRITPQEAFDKFPIKIERGDQAGDLNQEPFDYEQMVRVNTAANKAKLEAMMTPMGIAVTNIHEILKEHDNLGFDSSYAAFSAIKKDPSIVDKFNIPELQTRVADYTTEKARIDKLQEFGQPNPGVAFFKKQADFNTEISKRVRDYKLAKGSISNSVRQEIIRAVEFEQFQKDNPGMGIQEFQQGNRGSITFVPNSAALIRLTDSADLTTFLHESAHQFFQIYEALAVNPDAPQFFRDQMSVINTWLGRAPHETLTRAQHEMLADGFEHYLFTGKAPNEGLKSVFRMFANWFKGVYKSLSSMRVKFSPEVRHVVETMLAASDQIDMAETQLRAKPMFEKRDQASMTDEDWIDYQNTALDATDRAIENLTKRSLNDMKWLRRARSKELTRLQKLTEERRSEARAAATEEVQNRPERQVERFLKTGEITQEDGSVQKFSKENHTMSRSDLQDMYAQLEDVGLAPDWEKLKAFISKDGVHPDVIASMAGFKSGDEMVRKLLSLNPIDEDIESLTDLHMLENYGDIYNKETLEKAVDIAVHNDARIKMAAKELKFLGEAVNLTKLQQAAKRFAEQAIGDHKVGTLRVRDFELAEARSAKKSLAALAKGDNVEAIMHKKNQILNGIASKYAAQALDEIDKLTKDLKRYKKPAVRDAIGHDTYAQIASIMEQFGFKEPVQETRQSLPDWIDEQNKSGMDPDIAPWIFAAPPTQFNALTVDQFRDVMSAIRSVEQIGRNRQNMLRTAQAITFAEAARSAEESIHANAKKTLEKTVSRPKGFMNDLRAWKGELNLFDFVMREMDGWKDNGVMYKLLVRSKNEAADFETKRLGEAYKALNKLQKTLFDGPNMNSKIYVDAVKLSMSRWERIMLALYTGTKESYQRLIDGGIYGGPEKLTPDQIKGVLDTLTKTEMDYVQGVWDFNESFRPEIEAKEKRLNGYAPKMVEAIPVETRHGDYRGGYMNIRYDFRGTGMPSNREEADEAYEKARLGRYVGQTTAHGFLKERVKEVKNRPLSLDPSTITRHVQGVVHDLAFHEWSIDAWRMLHSDRIAQAIRAHYDESVLQNLRESVRMYVAGNLPANSQLEKVTKYFMKGSAIATMAFNINSALLQPLGLLQSIPRIGAKGLAVGIMRAFGNVGRLELPSTYAMDRSQFMINNQQSFVKELNLFRTEIESAGKLRRGFDRLTDGVVNDAGFALIRGMNTMTNNVVWLGAESKGINELGMEPEEAARFADQTVRDTQGSGMLTDRTLVERNVLGQVFTMYWTFFSRTYNLSREIAGKQRSIKDIPRTAFHFGMMIGASSMISQIVYALTRGKDPADDLTPTAFGQDLASFLLNMVPGIREFSGSVKGYDYRGPAALRFLLDANKVMGGLTSTIKGDQYGNHEFDEAFWKSLADSTGTATHLPVTLVDKNLRGLLQYMDNNENPEQIIFGPKIGGKK